MSNASKNPTSRTAAVRSMLIAGLIIATVLVFAVPACSGDDDDAAFELTLAPGGAAGDPNGEWLDEVAEIEPVVGGLPDLVSEAPLPRAIQELDWAGVPIRVVRFDGHVTNIGPGVLDIYGDPRLSDPTDPTSHDVWQRVWNGEEWERLAKPPVRFEGADGHDHFHLMQIARYSMWDVHQAYEVAPGEKIGFCLFDSEPISDEEESVNPEYLSNDGWFCRQGAPLAETVRMGISPGWRDLYDFTLALQWIDVSNVAPGLYWLANESDPFDQISEADEANNELVFSPEPFNLPGYLAAPLEVADNAGAEVSFALGHATIGVPIGDPVFVIESLPADAALFSADGTPVATGDRLTDPMLTWRSGEGGAGVVTFSVVTDGSPFPNEPVRANVVLLRESDPTPPPLPVSGARRVVLPGSQLDLFNLGDSIAAWEIIDDETGQATLDQARLVTGSNEGTITLRATLADRSATVAVSVVAQGNRPPFVLDPISYIEPDPAAINAVAEKTDASMLTVDERAVLLVPVLDADGDPVEVTVSGLPRGLEFDENASVISGTPTEVGETTVTVTANDGADETDHEFVLEVVEAE